MLAGKRIAVVMPAYNEAKLIAGALEGIPSFVDHIIVVDDASLDPTAKIVRSFRRGIDLVEHPSNRGVGAAIATGCRRALSLGADLTAVMAADGQMDPVDLPSLLAPLIAGEADYTHGNRLGWPAAREAMPWHRWLGNHIFSLLTRYALGVEVQDSQCGYAAMNRRAQQALDWDRLWKGYGYPNDLLSALTLCGLRVREIPVRPVYGAEQSGIRIRHVLVIIPFVIARAWARRYARRRELAAQPGAVAPDNLRD
jgi:glycosyltransferase involved in cell wall biosynthesis